MLFVSDAPWILDTFGERSSLSGRENILYSISGRYISDTLGIVFTSPAHQAAFQ
jgi:hypothetical protein